MRCHFRAIVGDDHGGPAASPDQAVEFAGQSNSGQRSVDHRRESFSGAVIHDAQNAEPLIIDGDSWDIASDEDQAEYSAALDEFHEKYGEPYPFHTGGFEPIEGGTPVFILDGAVVSEYCIRDPLWLLTLVERLTEENAWFMAEPPHGDIEFWTLYVQLPSVAIVNKILKDTEEGMMTRGLHTAGWGKGDDDEDRDG